MQCNAWDTSQIEVRTVGSEVYPAPDCSCDVIVPSEGGSLRDSDAEVIALPNLLSGAEADGTRSSSLATFAIRFAGSTTASIIVTSHSFAAVVFWIRAFHFPWFFFDDVIGASIDPKPVLPVCIIGARIEDAKNEHGCNREREGDHETGVAGSHWIFFQLLPCLGFGVVIGNGRTLKRIVVSQASPSGPISR